MGPVGPTGPAIMVGQQQGLEQQLNSFGRMIFILSSHLSHLSHFRDINLPPLYSSTKDIVFCTVYSPVHEMVSKGQCFLREKAGDNLSPAAYYGLLFFSGHHGSLIFYPLSSCCFV